MFRFHCISSVQINKYMSHFVVSFASEILATCMLDITQFVKDLSLLKCG